LHFPFFKFIFVCFDTERDRDDYQDVDGLGDTVTEWMEIVRGGDGDSWGDGGREIKKCTSYNDNNVTCGTHDTV
jgi:hypothetical protein